MKKGFMTGPKDKYGNSKIINLDTVSNVAFEKGKGKDRDGNPKFKIIFNFAYFISLKQNIDKKVADYVYFIFSDEDEYNGYVDKLQLQIKDDLWIAPKKNNLVDRIVNPDFISFVATDPSKNRVIFNLASSVSYYNEYSRYTSDFIYLDFATYEDYKDEYLYISQSLENR